MINLTPQELKVISNGLEIAIGTFEHENYMEISEKWSKVQKKIDNYLTLNRNLVIIKKILINHRILIEWLL